VRLHDQALYAYLILDGELFLAPICENPHVLLFEIFLWEVTDARPESDRRRNGNRNLGNVSFRASWKTSGADGASRDLADKFPSAQVTSTDISDIQPYFVTPCLT
jgi:hypothetical protein